jgi:hypothetical protein
MTSRNKIRALLVFLAALVGFAAGQTSLTQTTLASAVTGPAYYNGLASGSAPLQTTIYLTSVSGIAAPTLPGSPVSWIYVGREAMGVFAVNTSLNNVSVRRGDLGTQAAPHPTGDMVLISLPLNVANGGNPVANGFFNSDPPLNGNCIATATGVSPWVNVTTAAQWLCSPTSNTWVPGFYNPLNPGYMGDMGTVASVAGACSILGPFYRMSGTNACSSFTIPIGMDATAVGQASFCVYPTAAFTTTATNNIASASTAVIGKMLCFTWNPSTSKFSASY